MSGTGCCPLSGYDLYEEQIRDEFVEMISRKGYDLSVLEDSTWVYSDPIVDELWRCYHVGHVRGRTFWSEN